MAERRPYLRRLDRGGGVDVWLVDGHYVRDQMDVEFTNGHHHFSRNYVPLDEIWIDRSPPDSPDEWQFWAERNRIEREHMAKGAPYLTALRIAARVERAARLAARRPGPTPIPPGELRSLVRRRQIGSLGGREVWVVDGHAVRDLAYVDFTLGGHGHRYRFVPRGEIWLDDAVRPAERPAILHHEGVEVEHMARGMKYDEAHALASRAETAFRRRAARGRR